MAQNMVAIAQQQTNAAQSVANQALAQSVDNSPGVLTSQCLTILAKSVDNGGSVPVDACGLGVSSGVIVNSGK